MHKFLNILKNNGPHSLGISKIIDSERRSYLNICCFRTRFGSQCVNGSQTLLKSARRLFYLIISSTLDKLSWKASFRAIFKILGLFINTLTADGKYSLHNRENFPQPIWMILLRKPRTFCKIFIAFFKYA